jgi:hypothetical protein
LGLVLEPVDEIGVRGLFEAGEVRGTGNKFGLEGLVESSSGEGAKIGVGGRFTPGARLATGDVEFGRTGVLEF